MHNVMIQPTCPASRLESSCTQATSCRDQISRPRDPWPKNPTINCTWQVDSSMDWYIHLHKRAREVGNESRPHRLSRKQWSMESVEDMSSRGTSRILATSSQTGQESTHIAGYCPPRPLFSFHVARGLLWKASCHKENAHVCPVSEFIHVDMHTCLIHYAEKYPQPVHSPQFSYPIQPLKHRAGAPWTKPEP